MLYGLYMGSMGFPRGWSLSVQAVFFSSSNEVTDRVMAKTGATGIQRIIKAATYSKQGLKAGLKYEAALRQELALGIVLTVLALLVADNATELVLLILMPWLTFVVEILNSAIEAVVDRIGDEYHELSGRAKDLGSAAVLLMLILTGFTWLTILVI